MAKRGPKPRTEGPLGTPGEKPDDKSRLSVDDPVTIGSADAGDRLFEKHELRVTPAPPHIMAPLSKIKELGSASNTFWTALFTFCAGAFISSWPLAMEALKDLNEGRVPDMEAHNQLKVLYMAGPVGVLSGVFVILKLGRFNRELRGLEKGKRFMWDEATNKTTPITVDAVEPQKPWWQRAYDYVTNRK